MKFHFLHRGLIASLCLLMASQSSLLAQESFRAAAVMQKAVKKQIFYRLPNFDREQTITVDIIDGYAILDGDIVLYKESAGQDDGAIAGGNYRWANGVIPYTIAAGHPRAAEIQQAIGIMNQQTKLCIRPRTNEADYVEFINGSGCYSSVGRQGGKQDISISGGCAFGSIQHELLHAAGMYHEQSRADRDSYVNINLANVQDGKAHNFNKISNAISTCSYDFGSIMHYGLTAFSKNGQQTITPIAAVPPGVTIGQRNAMSACDKSGINALYPTANGCGGCPPFKVYGEIGNRYNQLGGANSFLKCAKNDETGTPDGKGRFNHFQGGSIYWHPSNPNPRAFEVHGEIRNKWEKLGWEVAIGYPITDELATPDGKGRFNHFRKYNAQGQGIGDLSLYWHPSNPGERAYLIFGEIRNKWAKLGWEKFTGFPITDETPTPDGKGRFNHFRKYNAQGQAIGDMSIYWHPNNPGDRAFVIYGAIRDKWASIGWERSALGYPITDELAAQDNGRVSYFTNGAIYWSAARGAVVLQGKRQGQPLF